MNAIFFKNDEIREVWAHVHNVDGKLVMGAPRDDIKLANIIRENIRGITGAYRIHVIPKNKG